MVGDLSRLDARAVGVLPVHLPVGRPVALGAFLAENAQIALPKHSRWLQNSRLGVRRADQTIRLGPALGHGVNESELIQGCKRGDRAAQRELYVRSSEKIYRLLMRMTRNPDVAFDLAQETYVRAFDRIQQFNGNSSIETWLYRIAVNEALQFQRRKVPQPLLSDDLSPETAAVREGDRLTTRLDVKSALDRLDPDDRTILTLRYQEGLDYRAIAEVLGCPGGTVASRLNRARDRLRETLGNGYGAGEEKAVAGHLKDAG